MQIGCFSKNYVEYLRYVLSDIRRHDDVLAPSKHLAIKNHYVDSTVTVLPQLSYYATDISLSSY